MLHFVVVACNNNEEGRKTREENADDFCRLCGVNLKIKFGNFQKITKYISMENLFKPSGRTKRGGTTLAELLRNWREHCRV